MAAENGILIRNHPRRPPPPQDEGWSWMIVVGVFIYVFFMVGTAKSYGLFMLAFVRHFGVSVAYASLPLSVSGILYAFGAPAALLIAEKYQAKYVVIFGAIVGMIGIAISSALVSMGFVVFFFGVWYGVGNSCFYGNGLVMIGKYFNKRRSLATGLGLAGASIGQFAMPPIIEFLLETYGLSGTLLVMGALYFHAAISGALFRPLSDYGPPLPKEVPKNPIVKNVKASEVEEKSGGETKVFVPIRDEPALSEEGAILANEKNCASHTVSMNGKTVESNGEVRFTAEDESIPLHDDESLEKIKLDDGEEEEDDDDEAYGKLAERKALFASTGSVFLVSPTVVDVTDVDGKAHGFSPNPPTRARLRQQKRKALFATINKVFDFRVLRSYVTLFYTLDCFLCFFGYFSHILFLPGILKDKGISGYDTALLISMCGAGDLISRVSAGFFADLNLIPRYRISATTTILCGLNIAMTLPAQGFWWLAVHCVGYGFFGGAYVGLLSVVLVDMVGLALMSKNLAVILLIQGVGAAFGQPILGWIKDATGSYNIVIIISFIMLSGGGLLLFAYPLIRRWENARLARTGKLV